ncbi:ATP phosphoribosyltransferase regulatory subunit [Anaerostipes sp.]|uniref:ATP phosphoribosyltransferase regulatory subunit n=1 Tax=Anaerostipes sp. TaxID=1872530 RepID=UPI0025BA5517|nr:ATP phosphoribosyltransferase regulatory subunit [Anaerostipes sp.]MBS7008023.1 ATP phosphoribosyltransferase regulatory subunit [Anaerostipes sp.]
MNQKRVHTPEGVRDIYGLECKKRLRLKDKLNHVFQLYGYENIITPTFEFFDIFNSEKGTVSSKEMYKFFDREGNTLVLRPDITPSVARCVAKYYDSEERNLRFAYTGNVFQNNSSYQLKLKETCQMGAELINDASSHGDGEIIAMALDCCLNAGLKDFRLTIGQVEYFQGLVECIGDEDVKEQLRELIINKNFFGLIEFVEGLDIPQNVKDVFVQFNELNGDVDILDKADALVSNETSKRAIRKLRKVYRMLQVYGLEQYISFDLGMLSRHNYYTGVIFKAYTYGTGDAVLKGGRYDNLIEQFGKKAPSVGFAIVLDNLMMAMERQKIEMEADVTDMLIIYEEDAMEAAIPAAVNCRKEQKTVILEKRSRDLEEYKAMASEQSIGCILYYETRDTVKDLTKGQ